MNKLLGAKKKKALESFNRGDLDAAEKAIKQVCQKAKRDAESWYILGLVSANKGNSKQAAEAFERVIKIGENNKFIKDASVNLGVALSAQKKYKSSRNILEKVVAKYPDEAGAYLNLVTSCQLLKDFDKAFEYAQIAYKLLPEDPMALQNYGVMCSVLEKYDLAEEAFEKAIRLDRKTIKHYMSYARMLGHARKFARAIEMYKTVLSIEPKNVAAILMQLDYKVKQGFLTETLKEYRSLLQDGTINVIDSQGYLLNLQYDYNSGASEIFEAHRAWGAAYSAHYKSTKPKQAEFTKQEKLKLKIAYISPDLRGHPVSYFMESILRDHNRDNVEVYCFAHLDREDAVSHKLKQLSDHWFDITLMQDDEVAALIRSQNIDIAVDLAGHSGKSRLKVLAQRVAPVQATYLGYPATTGLPEVDYRLVDDQTDPAAYDQYATETLIRVPDCFLCYANEEIPIVELDEKNNNTQRVTFGSFNNASKINEQVVKVWSKLLSQTENSVLLMKHKVFDDPEVQNRYRELFKKQGIDETQLELVGKIKDVQEHLQFYSKIEVALDTFPYNGTTTTCDALWMGVPVITLCGDRHAARVGNSLLKAIGMQDWVAHTEDEYIQKAQELASDTQNLKTVKSGLRQQMQQSVLCDGLGFVKKLETIYADLYKKWCEE